MKKIIKAKPVYWLLFAGLSLSVLPSDLFAAKKKTTTSSSETSIETDIKKIKSSIKKMNTAKGLLISDFATKTTIAAIPLIVLLIAAGAIFAISIVSDKTGVSTLSLLRAMNNNQGSGGDLNLKEKWENICHIVAISTLRKNALSYFLLLPATHLAISGLKSVPLSIELANKLSTMPLSEADKLIVNRFNHLVNNDLTLKGLIKGVKEVHDFDNHALSILKQYPNLAKQLGKKGLKNTKKWLWASWEINNLKKAYADGEKAAWEKWNKKKDAAFAKGKTLKKPKKIPFHGRITYARKIKSREKIINSLNKKYPAFKELGKEVITNFAKGVEEGRLKGKAR